MSKKYETPQLFIIKQSKLLLYWLLFTHVLAIIAVFLSAVSLLIQWLICPLLIISFIFYSRLRDNGRIIRYAALTGWEMAYPKQGFSSIKILPTTVISTFLIVLHFETDIHQKKTILIGKDSLAENKYRQLLVSLKINGLNKDDL
ncbi:MAG: hypothetical protein HFP77_03395 [Methylococcales symbiont of Iophon sp. n. MRB-2018]|nr:MAG: hypothetical protein HFP77_03395 [Methylococcales symbiont of Iophon sp. n. MRB-2018]KAF3980317.1 MAG: hypothetical protein HFP76_02780 [Methylococcales symbiont of Iophon sp. n. MRB-2018]